mmetsp:Transcript_20182/g.55901  ORF Transcript_20182/g.55901 Transcript_20182/m.55901 type:complete len:202 (+) Transcript_20182:605-1210(+)
MMPKLAMHIAAEAPMRASQQILVGVGLRAPQHMLLDRQTHEASAAAATNNRGPLLRVRAFRKSYELPWCVTAADAMRECEIVSRLCEGVEKDAERLPGSSALRRWSAYHRPADLLDCSALANAKRCIVAAGTPTRTPTLAQDVVSNRRYQRPKKRRDEEVPIGGGRGSARRWDARGHRAIITRTDRVITTRSRFECNRQRA